METEAKPPPADRLLLSNQEVATMLGISARMVRKLVSGGGLPAPKKVGRLARWRRAEIEA
jgi:excisionase family DNA binding protein